MPNKMAHELPPVIQSSGWEHGLYADIKNAYDPELNEPSPQGDDYFNRQAPAFSGVYRGSQAIAKEIYHSRGIEPPIYELEEVSRQVRYAFRAGYLFARKVLIHG
jgi:hypothetical protein